LAQLFSLCLPFVFSFSSFVAAVLFLSHILQSSNVSFTVSHQEGSKLARQLLVAKQSLFSRSEDIFVWLIFFFL
jgi:hypothetical protein